MMSNGSILYIPIQINGGQDVPKNLLERELFIRNGELYVGNGTSEPDMIIGKVVKGAKIENPTLLGSVTLGEGVAPSGHVGGKLVFVDGGQFDVPDELEHEDWVKAIRELVARMENLSGNSGVVPGVHNTILEAGLEDVPQEN